MKIGLTLIVTVLLQVSCFGQNTQQADTSCLVKYFFHVYSDQTHIDTFTCVIADTLLAAVKMSNAEEDLFFNSNKNLHFKWLEMSNAFAISFPRKIPKDTTLEGLWMTYPNCTWIDNLYLKDHKSLKSVQIMANSHNVPSSIYDLPDLEDVGLILRRDVELDTSKTFMNQLDNFSTDVNITENNAIAIKKINPKVLHLHYQRKTTKYYPLLCTIETIYINGEFNRRQQKKLKMYLPHAAYEKTK